jgi:hypothetical protein
MTTGVQLPAFRRACPVLFKHLFIVAILLVLLLFIPLNHILPAPSLAGDVLTLEPAVAAHVMQVIVNSKYAAAARSLTSACAPSVANTAACVAHTNTVLLCIIAAVNVMRCSRSPCLIHCVDGGAGIHSPLSSRCSHQTCVV